MLCSAPLVDLVELELKSLLFAVHRLDHIGQFVDQRLAHWIEAVVKPFVQVD